MNFLNTLVAIRRAPHSVEASRLPADHIAKLFELGFIRKHRDNPALVFTVKEARPLADSLTDLTATSLADPPLVMTNLHKSILMLLRRQEHGVSLNDVSHAISELRKAGFIRTDKRDAGLSPLCRHWFTRKGKREAIDGILY